MNPPGANPTSGQYAIIAPHRWSMIGLTLTSLVGGLLEAFFLIAVAGTAFAITDGEGRVELIASRSVPISGAVTLMFLLVVSRIVFASATAWQSARLSALVTAQLRSRLAAAFLHSAWAAQHGERQGQLQELLTTYSQRGNTLIRSLVLAISAGFSLLALLLASIVVDPFASMAVIVLVAVLASLLRPLRNAIRRKAKRSATTSMEFSTSLSEISQLGMEMHVFNVQAQTNERVSELIRNDAVITRQLMFLQGLVPAIYSGLVYIALVAGLAALASLNATNISSVGAVMLLMLRSLSYGQMLQTSSASISSALPFLESFNEEIDKYEAARVIDRGTPIERTGRLTLTDASFEYTSNVPVLHSVSLSIEEHEIVGIVGPSGSGKSTLVQLLLALRDPTSGTVSADGRDVRNLSRAEWARKVTFVPQQAHLIAGTVADNIRFLRDDVTQEQIERASRLANLHDDVEGFAEGYERQVGEQGSHLSGGQQQRLIIARALVENPDVLILDEPTSALDVRSEDLIRQTLDRLREQMTIIIIAHRLSTLSICDRIMVVQDGELKGFDTPEKLEQTNDFFREALKLSGLR